MHLDNFTGFRRDRTYRPNLLSHPVTYRILTPGKLVPASVRIVTRMPVLDICMMCSEFDPRAFFFTSLA